MKRETWKGAETQKRFVNLCLRGSITGSDAFLAMLFKAERDLSSLSCAHVCVDHFWVYPSPQ